MTRKNSGSVLASANGSVVMVNSDSGGAFLANSRNAASDHVENFHLCCQLFSIKPMGRFVRQVVIVAGFNNIFCHYSAVSLLLVPMVKVIFVNPKFQ